MADDPMTVVSAVPTVIRDGLVLWDILAAGPADYDVTNGSAFDVSAYVSAIKQLSFGAVTAKADALVVPRYVNDDLTDADGGAVYFTWSGTAGAVLDNADDTTNFSGYQWQVTLMGAPA